LFLQHIRNYLGRREGKQQKAGDSLITRSFIICIAHKIKEVEIDGHVPSMGKDTNAYLRKI
jgi:hypothetical protein